MTEQEAKHTPKEWPRKETYAFTVTLEDAADEEDFLDRLQRFYEDCPYPAEPADWDHLKGLAVELAGTLHEIAEDAEGTGSHEDVMMDSLEEIGRMARAALDKAKKAGVI